MANQPDIELEEEFAQRKMASQRAGIPQFSYEQVAA